MNELRRIENSTVYRLHDPSGQTSTEIGDTALGISFKPRQSQEFALTAGFAGNPGSNVEITPDNCKLASVGDSQVVAEYRHDNPDLLVKVCSSVGGDGELRKWLEVTNQDSRAVMLLTVVLEKMSLPDGFTADGGGRSWPVLIKNLGFAAVDFPEFDAIVAGPKFTLLYYPAVTLQPDETYRTESSVIRLGVGDPMETFRACVKQIRRRPAERFFSSYSSQGAHECEGPNERVLNEELDHLIEFKTTWRVPIEYFIVDGGYWQSGPDPCESGRFGAIDTERRFPGGTFDHLCARLMGSDMKLGMWFGLKCCADPVSVNNLKTSLLQMIPRYGIKLLKLHLPEWDCTDGEHEHVPGRFSRYRAARNIIDLIAAVRALDPDLVVLASGFTRSPWWLKYADLMSPGALVPSDVPSPSMRDSEIIGVDQDHKFFEIDPGVCVSYSDSHYWNGKQCWRKGLLMSLARSNQLSLSGQVHLLDEDDRLFLQRVYHMRRVLASSFGDTRRVQLSGGVYGYANTVGGRGIVSLFNPSWEIKRAEMSAESVGCDSSMRNVCIELFPEKKALEIPAGGSLQTRMMPWEVSWFEVGASDEMCDPPRPEEQESKNCPLLVNAVAITAEVADVMPLPVEQVLYETGSMFRCNPVLPRSWQGFPIMVDRKRVDGELYINNRPVMWSDGAPYALLYPWTLRYAMLRFGKENVFYMATNDTKLVEQGEMVFSALPYYSSSAARDDWPYDTNATIVAVVKYLKDDRPHRPTHDPRDARCSVWVDGSWTDIYRVPPNVPRIKPKYSWAVFMHDLKSDWECVRVVIPKLIDCDYEVEVFLTNKLTAAEYMSGE